MDVRRSDASEWRIPVAAWAEWGSDSLSGARPDLDYIEPMLRRRLSPLAKAALHVANQCAADHDSVQFVYASRHGELNRTVESLYNLAREEVVSPTTFSLSVLNSAAGIFSIARADHAPATAISAGTESFGFGLLEAWIRATRNPERPVLFVYGDAPAPAPLHKQACDPDGPLAVAILIDAASAKHTLTMRSAVSAQACSDTPQALACVGALRNAGGAWNSGKRVWQWERSEI